MSDKRIVARDNRYGEQNMSVPVVLEARTMLEALTVSSHRGPRDTWTAARDRTAKKIGLAPAYAARLWHRWQDMKDVSGAAYRIIRHAYEAECLKHERAADLYRSLERTPDGRTLGEGPASAGLGMVAVPQAPPSPARELHRD